MRTFYTLDENDQPVLATIDQYMDWAKDLTESSPVIKVKQQSILHVFVSTVYLGINHNFFDLGPPILWETMVFGGWHDGYQERYSSKKESVEGHARAVRMVKRDLWKPGWIRNIGGRLL